jgi:ABC-type siderophore export system fused ATPase/permease subunit
VIAGIADRVITISNGRIANVARNEKKTAARELVW